jgi:uncharacterized oxidoreductase
MRLNGNTILITGSASGIGRALAEILPQRGNQVIIAGRRQALLDEITAAHPGMRGMPLDAEDPAAIDPFARQVQEQFPELNMLINNAGVSRPEDLAGQTVDLSVARSIIQTNILGVLHLTTAVLPTLRRQPTSTILTTSSGVAFIPLANFPTYCASKAFLHSCCSRCASSSARRPSRSSSSSRPTSRRSSRGAVRYPTPTPCRWSTTSPK